MSDTYKIKMLKSKHGTDIGDVLFVHSKDGFNIGKLRFKPKVAREWIESGIAELCKARVKADG
jgi:hypothetical protein